MATLREIVYNIKNIAEGGTSLTEDSKISDSQVEFLVNAYRAKTLMQYTNSGRSVHPQTLQTFKHTASTDNNTFIDFPSVINFNENRAVKWIVFYDSSASTSEYIEIGTKGSIAYLSGNRFTSAKKTARIQDGRIYFSNFDLDDGDYLEVSAIFSNPTEITTNVGLFDKDTSIYPLPTELITTLTQEILAKEYRVIMSTPRDKEIDGEAPTEVQGQVRQR